MEAALHKLLSLLSKLCLHAYTLAVLMLRTVPTLFKPLQSK